MLLEDKRLQCKNSLPLVVCPSSLMLSWQSEIEKSSKTLTSIIISDFSDKRRAQIRSHEDYDVVIISYDHLKQDTEAYEDLTFQYQIIDEAQYIKNHNTRDVISAKQIQTRHRFTLTGVSIKNSLTELWSISDFLILGYLYTYSYFRKQYEQPIVKENDIRILRELKCMVGPFTLWHVKKDVLKKLPEKVENTMLIGLDEETRRLYMTNISLIRGDPNKGFKEKGFTNSRIMIPSMLTRLRWLCHGPRLLYENYNGIDAKISACMEFIESCRESGEKVLLFSQLTSLLSLLEKELIRQDIPYYLLKRSTPKLQRRQLVNNFSSDDTSIFLISLKTGGTDLNLINVEVVIHFDLWWDTSARNQATDRVHRIGQHSNVQIVELVVKNTIEEKAMQLQSLRQDLSDSTIHNNEGIIINVSKEELTNLF